MDLCGKILQSQISDQTPFLRFMQLEMAWVISIIAYSNENVIWKMFENQYGLVNFLNLVLMGNDQ
jgi:hypothetical protein